MRAVGAGGPGGACAAVSRASLSASQGRKQLDMLPRPRSLAWGWGWAWGWGLRRGWGSDLHIHTLGRAETRARVGSLFSAQLEVTHVTAPVATTPVAGPPGWGAERGHPMPPALASRQPKAVGR